MKARILELISTPEHIVAEDLPLLKEEIAVQPYAQSLRALYLLGIKKYDTGNFQKVLATTAAYTTDKKILYQFINGKTYEPKVAETIPETPFVKPFEEEVLIKNKDMVPQTVHSDIEPESNYLARIPKREFPGKVIVNGEVNRILFEGEENFLEEKAVKIDLEATEESGVLVTENTTDVANEEVKPIAAIEKSPEKFKEDLLTIKSEIIKNNGNEVLNETQVVANATQIVESSESENRILDVEFEPEAVLPKTKFIIEKSSENKYETERKQLALEIEQKLLQGKKVSLKSNDKERFEEENATVDFHQTQEFSLNNNNSKKNILDQNNEDFEIKTSSLNTEEKGLEKNSETGIVENSNWKPMQQADKTASKSRFSEQQKEISAEPETSKIPEQKSETVVENTEEKEVQPMNISFFAPTISDIKEEEEKELLPNPPEESNVPIFINTWQNWLKLDRSEPKVAEKEEVSKEKIKSEAIEKFIDAAPKISKLKEEVTFTVKEKKDDINHLMTETLAKLFLTQKLYAKAINAYKILQEKHPERTEEFEIRIEEIKVLRQK